MLRLSLTPRALLNVISRHKKFILNHKNTIPVSSFTTLTSAFGSPMPPSKAGKKRASFTPILPRTPVQQQVSCLFVPCELSRNLIWNSTSKWIIFRTVRLKARKSQALIGKGRGKSHSILLFLVTYESWKGWVVIQITILNKTVAHKWGHSALSHTCVLIKCKSNFGRRFQPPGRGAFKSWQTYSNSVATELLFSIQGPVSRVSWWNNKHVSGGFCFD